MKTTKQERIYSMMKSFINIFNRKYNTKLDKDLYENIFNEILGKDMYLEVSKLSVEERTLISSTVEKYFI